MSAECSVCGHDLSYEGNCEFCALRARAEQTEAAFNRLLDDKDAMEGKLMAERDETKGLFEGAMWQVRLHWEEGQKAEARAEQAEREVERLQGEKDAWNKHIAPKQRARAEQTEALLREWVSPVPTEYPDSLYERTLEALAATTPATVVPGPAAGALGWEPPTCPTCDQFGYIANLACSDDFHRATTPGEPDGEVFVQMPPVRTQRLVVNQEPDPAEEANAATTPGEPDGTPERFLRRRDPHRVVDTPGEPSP